MSSTDPLTTERQRVLLIVDDWIAAYPESAFPPITLGTAKGNTPDRIAAHAIRHAMRQLRKQIEEARLDALPAASRFIDEFGDLDGIGWLYLDAEAAS